MKDLQAMEIEMSSTPRLVFYLGSWRPITFGAYNNTSVSLASFYRIFIFILFFCFSINNMNFLKFQHFQRPGINKITMYIIR